MKKILVIQQKMIGDVLVSSIICNNLKIAYPKAQIDYMVYEYTTSVLEGNPYIDNFILFKDKHRNSKWAFYKLILEIRKTNYDIVIDAYSKLESWLPVLFLKSQRKISYKKIGKKFLYNDNVDLIKNPKTNLGLIIERRLSLLKPLQLHIDINPFPKLYVSDLDIEFAKTLFSKHKVNIERKTIMISIIGSSENKTFPLIEMSKVIDFIVEQGNFNILFNYVPNQIADAKQVFEACTEATKKNIYFDLLGQGLREFIAIMNECHFIIGNDGGAINMAKALDKPSFIIFSPWIEKKMWATFEDGKFHKSVHLNDYMPELFENKSRKQLKKESLNLYKHFKLNHFSKELKAFLEYNESTSKKLTFGNTIEITATESKLSVLVITLNELNNIDALFESISFADEIIIVDSFSTDGTADALKKYKKVKLIQRKFSNFSDQRNFAIKQASHDWVLFVDADERITKGLEKEIKKTINNPQKFVAFGFYRKFFFQDVNLKFGGYQTDKVFRLFHKEYAIYDKEKLVHELLKISGKSKLLTHKLNHFSYVDNADFKQKLNHYAKLRAEELFLKKLKPSFFHFYIKPGYGFFHLYVLRFGFLDGIKGYKMARLSAYGIRQRYVELEKLLVPKNY